MRPSTTCTLKCKCGAEAKAYGRWDVQGDGVMTGEIFEVIDNDDFIGGDPACQHDDAEVTDIESPDF